MTTFIRRCTRYSSLLTFTILLLTSCKEDERVGPEGALGKSFNLAVPSITSSIAYSLLVSSDGTKIFSATQANNSGFYYSSDGGKTFKQIDNIYLNSATAIDNNGNILLSNAQIFTNGAIASMNSFDQLILGDNGKVFSYNQNSAIIKQRTISGGDFTTVTTPFSATPGSGGSTYYALKAPGKGLLFLDVSGSVTATRTVKAYLLDEASLTWTNATVTFNSGTLNTCNNLNRFERFTYAGNNTLTVKGCTGTALIDLTTTNATNLTYPPIENVIDTDLRDGQIFVDNKKQVYIIAGSYDDLTRKYAYKFDGTQWAQVDGFLALNTTSVFAADQAGNIYFNSVKGAGESLKGAVKMNVNTGTQTGLTLPTTGLTISDAATIGNDHVLVAVEGTLYDYDVVSGTKISTALKDINHINVLSDGRWLAGGTNHLYLSGDNGKNWIETKNIFSSIDPKMGSAAVYKSRIINNRIVINGVHKYLYYNLSLGVEQKKYDNIMIEFDGQTATKLSYQFPPDFLVSSLGPDGTAYGTALFVSEFGTVVDRYDLKENVTPERLKNGGITPQEITDSGLQMTINNTKDGLGFEVVTRGSSAEDWASSNTPLPGGAGSYDGLQIRLSGDKVLFIRQSEVYLSGN